MTLAKEFAVQRSSVEPRIVLSRHMLNERHIHLFLNFLKLLHALRVNILVLGVMGQIAGEQNEIRALGQPINHLDCSLEGTRA